MNRLLLALLLVLALVACQTIEAPPVTEAPVVEEPAPDPVFPPVADLSCPVVAKVVPTVPVAALAPTVVSVRLGSPCPAGSVVPVAWREQLLYARHDGAASYLVIFEGILHKGQALTFAIPHARRTDRFEVVDLRLGADAGAVVLAVQNGRVRQPW